MGDKKKKKKKKKSKKGSRKREANDPPKESACYKGKTVRTQPMRCEKNEKPKAPRCSDDNGCLKQYDGWEGSCTANKEWCDTDWRTYEKAVMHECCPQTCSACPLYPPRLLSPKEKY